MEIDPKIRELEIEAIRLAENNPSEALKLVDEIAFKLGSDYMRNYPSLWNNKAQILRLLGRTEEAHHLLNQILQIDNLNKTVRRQASAQRGWLLYRAGDREAAFTDFRRAGELGCGESRRMAAKCNPYAAMCNQMLQEIIQSTFYTQME